MIFGFSFSYITWGTSQDPPLMSSHTQPSMLTGGSQGPPWMSPTPSPPGSLGDPKGIPGSSLDVPQHTALQAVWRISRASQDPPWMLPYTQPSRQSGESQGHARVLPSCPHAFSPPCCLKDPKDIQGSSLGASKLTTLQAIHRIPRTSQDSSIITPHT